MLTWAEIAIGILYSGIAHERQPNFRHRKKTRNGGILRLRLAYGRRSKNLPSNTSGFSATMTFEEFLKRKASSNQSNDEEQTFKAIQKRKSNERTKSIKKKDEIVKVCLMVINYYF